MTWDQWMGILRQVLPLLGGIAIGLGFLTTDQVNVITQTVLQIAGSATTLASLIWSLIANSKASIITSAANMPEVKSVTLQPGAPDTPALAGPATPPNVRVG